MGGLLLTILSLGYRIQGMVPSTSRDTELPSPSSSASHGVLPGYSNTTFFPCKDANSNVQIHARVDGSLLWDLSSHQLNKGPSLSACRASTLTGACAEMFKLHSLEWV